MTTASGSATRAQGPVIVCGRQHSGTTMLATMLRRLPGCFAQIYENALFEKIGLLERLAEPARRAAAVCDELHLDRSDADLRVAYEGPVREHLAAWSAEHPSASIVELYGEAMRRCCELDGATYFAQKATSYIFYAEEILGLLPDARLVFMLRNPYDIASSGKKRQAKRRADGRPTFDPILGPAIAWNKGVRIAERIAAEVPDRFLIVRYEDLARDPEPEARRLCAFLAVDFDAAMLEIPHINKAETGYSTNIFDQPVGLNASRVFTYEQTLTAGELAALDLLLDRKLVARHYPDLPPRGVRVGAAARLGGGLSLGWRPARYVLDMRKIHGRSPAYMLARVVKRLR